ncbi:MAG: AAA family ATPase [Candidatus Caldarchaeum sp.]
MSNIIESVKFVLENQDSNCFQWPALIGFTGSGKTRTVNKIAEELNLPIRNLLLGTMLPEDILGLPKATKTETNWTVPDWAKDCIKQPCLIFMDELDKANSSCLSAVLTLMTDLQIRNIKLHPQTKIIAAMQPVDETFLSDQTGEAICARVIFFPMPYDNSCEYLAKKHNVSVNFLKELFKQAPDIAIPRLDKIPARRVDAALNFVEIALRKAEEQVNAFEVDAEKKAKDIAFNMVMPVLHGMFKNEHAVAIFSEKIKEFKFSTVSPVRVVKAIYNNPAIVNRLPDSALFPAMQEALFGRIDAEKILGKEADEESKRIAQALAFFAIVLAGQLRSKDSFNSAVEHLYDECKRLSENGKTEVDIFGDATPDDVIAISAAAAKASEQNKNIAHDISQDTINRIVEDFGSVYNRAIEFFNKIFSESAQ